MTDQLLLEGGEVAGSLQLEQGAGHLTLEALSLAVPTSAQVSEIGTVADFVNRLASLVPNSWFPAGSAPVWNTVLNAAATNLSWAYSLYAYALLQTRLATATGVWLDRIAYDFFGTQYPFGSGFPRRSWTGAAGTTVYESDASYRARIQAEILRERVTREGVIEALTELTGRAPLLIEPWNPSDTAAYDENAWYDQVGIYGDLTLPCQIFVTAYRPLGEGIPNIAGYDFGYYDIGTTAYVDLSQMTGQVPDSLIYATAAGTVAAGITCWMDIEDAVKPIPILLSLNFSNSINSQNLIPWFTG